MFEERKINPNLQKQYREQGYWKDETLLDCWDRTVETYPEREYVVDDRGNRYTYRELDEAAGRVASYLIGLGIQPGEVVSFQLPIWSEFAMLTIACYKVGAVAHPIAMSYEEKELARSLNITESRCYFGPTFFYKTDYEDRILAVRDQVPLLKDIVLIDSVKERKSDVALLREILTSYGPLPKERCVHTKNGQDIAVILSTSGTTGGTKGVLLTHDNVRYAEETFNRELGLTEEDIMFMPAPLHHATGFHHAIIAPMLHGAKVVLQQKYQCRLAIEFMNQENVTYSMGATPFIYDILRELETNGGEIPSLKFYLCGGAPVPGYLVQRAKQYGILLCEVYGSTESVPHAFVRPEKVYLKEVEEEHVEISAKIATKEMLGSEIIYSLDSPAGKLMAKSDYEAEDESTLKLSIPVKNMYLFDKDGKRITLDDERRLMIHAGFAKLAGREV